MGAVEYWPNFKLHLHFKDCEICKPNYLGTPLLKEASQKWDKYPIITINTGFLGDSAKMSNDNARYENKLLKDVKYGQEFTTCGSNYIKIDPKKFEDLTGQKSDYVCDPNHSLIFNIQYKQFTYQSNTAMVQLKKEKVRLGNLNHGSDFEYNGMRYYFISYSVNFDAVCINLDKKTAKFSRQEILDKNIMVYPLE